MHPTEMPAVAVPQIILLGLKISRGQETTIEVVGTLKIGHGRRGQARIPWTIDP
jgi:hypothetical protein